MEKSYLIKRKSLLMAGIKDADNANNIIVFDNMALRTDGSDPDPSNFVIPTEGAMRELVRQSELDAHKQIKGDISVSTEQEALSIIEKYTLGEEITLDGGETYIKLPYDVDTQPNGATAGDVIFFVANSSIDDFKTEEVLIKSDLEMVLLSSTNQDDKRLSAVESKDVTQDNRLDLLEIEDTNNNLKTDNDRTVTGLGVLTTDGIVVEGDKIARRDEISAPLAALKQEADANKVEADATKTTVDRLEPQVAANTAGVLDYSNSKADFLRIEDVSNSTEVDFATPIIMTEDGDDIVADLSGVTAGEITTLNTFVDDRLITIQAYPNTGVQFPVEYARDSWNNGMATANVILGRDITVESTWTADGVTPVVRELRIKGLTNPDRPNFVRDFTITSLSQLGGSAGAGIDAVARTTATAAQTTANDANAKADTASADVITLTAGLAAKQDKIDQGIVDGIDSTNTKSVVGAINSLHTRTTNNEDDIAELNKGKFDVNGDGTKITEIFDSNGDLNTPIKDLTALTNQGELYDAIAPNASVNQPNQYLITLNNKTGLITSTIIRTTTLIEFNFTTVESGLVVQNIIVCNKDSTAAPLIVAPRLRTLTPIHDDEATNKKYVDNKVPTIKTISFPPSNTKLPADIKFENIISISGFLIDINDAGLNKLQVSLSGYKETNWVVKWYGDINYSFTIFSSGLISSTGNWNNITISYWV